MISWLSGFRTQTHRVIVILSLGSLLNSASQLTQELLPSLQALWLFQLPPQSSRASISRLVPEQHKAPIATNKELNFMSVARKPLVPALLEQWLISSTKIWTKTVASTLPKQTMQPGLPIPTPLTVPLLAIKSKISLEAPTQTMALQVWECGPILMALWRF